jgi:hypothetical protein
MDRYPPEMICMLAALVYKKDHREEEICIGEAVTTAIKIANAVKRRLPKDAM